MFATFTSNMDAQSRGNRIGTQQGAPKPRRIQACERCRNYRVKCDSGQPCRNCRTRSVQCSREVAPAADQHLGVSPTMNRDLEILRRRVAELESQHCQPEQQQQSVEAAAATRVLPAAGSSPGAQRPETQGSTTVLVKRQESERKWQWPGVWIPHARTSQPQFYGQTSPNHLASRLGAYLNSTGEQQSQLGEVLLTLSADRTLAGLDPPLEAEGFDLALNPGDVEDPTFKARNLMRQQEEYLLSSFWQSYHSINPIVNEIELRKYYDSLWTPPWQTARKPSPLIDIILALCIQHSVILGPSSAQDHHHLGQILHGDDEDASLQGRWLFERCQKLLQPELDSASLLVVQCHIYSVIYLINLSAFNTARRMLCSAIHAAYAVALNQEPPEYLSESQRALSRRIWWTIVYLDTRLSLYLGQPFLVRLEDTTVDMLDSNVQEAAMGGAYTTIYEDISWLSYNTQSVKLMMAYRSICTAYISKYSDAMSVLHTNAVYDNPALLEECATLLAQNMAPLQDWMNNVPSPLKLTRKGTGESFLSMRCPVDVGTFIPLWLQRQRVLLELTYHNLIISLHRPFMRFPSPISSVTSSTALPTPTADGHAMSAVSHALVTIKIIHQILTETDLLNSWHAAYQYLWEAAVTLIGFSMVRPLCPFSASARKALTTAVDAFEIFYGYGFATAPAAAAIVKDLTHAIDEKTHVMRYGLASTAQKPDATSCQSCDSSMPSLVYDMPSHRTSVRSESLHRQQLQPTLPPLDGGIAIAEIINMSRDSMPTEMLDNFDNQNDFMHDAEWEAYLGLWLGEIGHGEKPTEGTGFG